jgi:hypothetical protein
VGGILVHLEKLTAPDKQKRISKRKTLFELLSVQREPPREHLFDVLSRSERFDVLRGDRLGASEHRRSHRRRFAPTPNSHARIPPPPE